MLDLLPEARSVGAYTHAPRFRAWKPEPEGVSTKEFWDFSSAIAQRLMAMTERRPSRSEQLVERLPDFPPPERSEALDKLMVRPKANGGKPALSDYRDALWAAVDELVRRHRAFADAEWALHSEEVDRLAAIANVLKPSDPKEANKWLFDSHLPDIGAKEMR
jgi:hypothetical protein